MSLGRKERMLQFVQKEQKDRKSKMKVGKLSDFSMSGLDAITPTLHLPVDALVGGINKGIIFEFFGDESAGKSITV